MSSCDITHGPLAIFADTFSARSFPVQFLIYYYAQVVMCDFCSVVEFTTLLLKQKLGFFLVKTKN